MRFFKQTIKDVPLGGRTVLVRADYNVPLTARGKISDDLRIRASLPTIEYLLEEGCRVVIISHLGRPKGREVKYSLEPVAAHLARLLGRDVRFVDTATGDKVRQSVRRLPAGGVMVLENLRFYAGEEENSEAFARDIARSTGADYFVQDGFGVVHRAHASTGAITLLLPSVAGLLLEREYTVITEAIKKPKRPLVAVLGGAKVSDKIALVERFTKVADRLVIGGAMANTFLAHKGLPTGKSKVEPGQTETLNKIYATAERKAGTGKADELIVLPVDVAVAPEIAAGQPRAVKPVSEVAESDITLDIGDKSIENMAGIVRSAGTVIWNGTLGYAELPEFAHGSARLALELATHPEITSVIGGGDTADFVLKWDSRSGESFTHVSTGGGAALELMAGEKLPGIEALLDARR